MRIEDCVAIVTGGASGIGEALCLALAEHGAKAVVVADIDGGGAAEVAAAVEARGARGLAVAADMANAADVDALAASAEEAFGQIDLFCSNAGIIVGGGIEVPDESWSRIWAINLHSHVYVTRAVLPKMLARGRGYLMFTASAAGLLTELYSAPYTVTKHALVGLAEWLSITYGDRGIGVSCLCPQAVRTNLGATSERVLGGTAVTPDMAALDAEGALPQAAVDGVLTPDQVAAVVIEGLVQEWFLILPHPEVATYERRRADDRDRWLRGMRRLAGRVAGVDVAGAGVTEAGEAG